MTFCCCVLLLLLFWMTFILFMRVLDRPREVSWEHPFLAGGLLDPHQPALLLECGTKKCSDFKAGTFFTCPHLFLWILVSDDVNDLADLKVELVSVLCLVLVGGLDLVKDPGREVVGRGTWKR